MRSSRLYAAAAIVLGLGLSACSGGSKSPTVASVPTVPTTTAAGDRGSPPPTKETPLAQAQAYSKCMRDHGVPKFPDPELTPGGDYGYRTNGIDGNSAAFQGALRACKDLPSPWNSSGKELTPSEQQAWLRWARCIRANGVASFPDPTFSGDSVRVSPPGGSSPSPEYRRAVDACRSQMPSAGGLGG